MVTSPIPRNQNVDGLTDAEEANLGIDARVFDLAGAGMGDGQDEHPFDGAAS